MDCTLLETCGFFRKYQNSLDLACRGFIKSYCKGEKMTACARKQFRQQHGTAPDDNMLPTGQMMPKEYMA